MRNLHVTYSVSFGLPDCKIHNILSDGTLWKPWVWYDGEDMAAVSPSPSPSIDELPLDDAIAEPSFPSPDDAVLRMRQEILRGQHWFTALLDAVGLWRLPQEWIGDREYRYLYGGDAFDWLLLAERLLDEVADLVPAKEVEPLLYFGIWPVDIDDTEFAMRIGQAKHSAHLNYLYGILVEEALQLSIEEEINKELLNRPWGKGDDFESMYERVYGHPFIELRALYYVHTAKLLRTSISYVDWKDFTYWLFRFRLKRQDKARVASDTRKGLAQLTRMERAVSERRHGATLAEAEFTKRFVATG